MAEREVNRLERHAGRSRAMAEAVQRVALIEERAEAAAARDQTPLAIELRRQVAEERANLATLGTHGIDHEWSMSQVAWTSRRS
jgi:hypothetical protein